MQQYQQQIKAIQGQDSHNCEQREVSLAPAIPFHVIRNPSISTILDLSVYASSDAKSIKDQNPLDILASQVVQMIEHTNQAQVVNGVQLTFPNCCSYKGCCTPLHLVLEDCLTCLRLVHQICQQFSVRLGINSSTLFYQVCFKEGEEITSTCLDLSAAAHPSTAQTMQETIEDFRVAYSRLQTAQIT
jgi:hypothetical protein